MSPQLVLEKSCTDAARPRRLGLSPALVARGCGFGRRFGRDGVRVAKDEWLAIVEIDPEIARGCTSDVERLCALLVRALHLHPHALGVLIRAEVAEKLVPLWVDQGERGVFTCVRFEEAGTRQMDRAHDVRPPAPLALARALERTLEAWAGRARHAPAILAAGV
eukprot:6174951-Pleurochrysis_carterae.AAC.3